jgi:hypothetical protein
MKPWVLGLLDKLPIDPLTSTAALFVSFQAHLRPAIMIQLYIHGAEALGVIFLRGVSYSSQKGIHACLGHPPLARNLHSAISQHFQSLYTSLL